MADDFVATQEAIDISQINIGGLRYLSDLQADLCEIIRIANWAYHGRITPKEAKKIILCIVYKQLCCGDSSSVGGSSSCGCAEQQRVVDFSAPFIVQVFSNKTWVIHINYTEFINNGQGEMLRAHHVVTISPNTKGIGTFPSWCECSTNPGALEIHGPNHENMNAESDVASGIDGSKHHEKHRNNIRTAWVGNYHIPIVERTSQYIINYPTLVGNSAGSTPGNPIRVAPGSTIVVRSGGSYRTFYLYRVSSTGKVRNPNSPLNRQTSDPITLPGSSVQVYESRFTLSENEGRMYLVTADLNSAPSIYVVTDSGAPPPA